MSSCLRIFPYALIIVVLLLLGCESSGRPVPFVGAWSFMAEHDGGSSMITVSHGIHREWAPGVSAMRYREGVNRIHTYFADINHLAFRRNAPNYQANVFLIGGLGFADGPEQNSAALHLALKADIEDRRRYLAFRYSWVGASGVIYREKFVGRVGWAPYEAGFNDLNTWLILQLEYETRGKEEWVVRPLVRFFYRSFLWELGSSLDGDIFANLTVQHRF
ncbi:MAG: hypothetical protein LR015_04120 [Verrucomicrobia bacterium]|nr:hypothetical protein [Verrucomicrobiota bacterium]